MIRLKTLDSEFINGLLAGIFAPDTTKETYIYINEVLSILPVSESVQGYYCILSALESLYEIYSLRGSVPSINKDVVMMIVSNNLYGELKENADVGFRELARSRCNIELDPFNEDTLAIVHRYLITDVEQTLQTMINLNFSIADSLAKVSVFLDHYGSCLAAEMSNIITNLNTNDSKILKYQYWGWSKFLRHHRINSILDLSKLLRLVAAHYENKTHMALKETAPLTTHEQFEALRKEYIKSNTPLGLWNVEALDNLVRLVPHEVTLIVGERGLGKTTLGGYITGNLMAQGKKVLFYCPEIMKHKLLFNFVLPAYVRAKYDFSVSAEQCLGIAPPYEHDDSRSVEERDAIIKTSQIEFVNSKSFYHSDRHYHIKTVADELRSKIVEFEPDVVIIDHTLEVRGENNMNIVTQVLADTFEELKKEFPIHIIALSHTGSEFTVPTRAHPIITSKIVAWSKRMEGVADNIIGAFASEGDCINLFFTKLRWAPLMPMYLIFNMERKHCWFDFDPRKQLSQQIDEKQIADLTNQVMYSDFDYDGLTEEDDGYTVDLGY